MGSCRRRGCGRSAPDQRLQLLEMVHDGIGAKLGGGCCRIAKSGRDNRDARSPRRPDVGLAVAHHDGGGKLPAREPDKFGDVPGVRLVEGERVAARDGIEQGADLKRGQEPPRQPLALVGAQGKPGAGAAQGSGRLAEAGEKLRLCGDIFLVMRNQPLAQAAQLLRIGFAAQGGNRGLKHRLGAIAHALLDRRRSPPDPAPRWPAPRSPLRSGRRLCRRLCHRDRRRRLLPAGAVQSGSACSPRPGSRTSRRSAAWRPSHPLFACKWGFWLAWRLSGRASSVTTVLCAFPAQC